MGFSLPHIIVILVIILIVFGAGRLPQVMEGLGKGIKNFKNAMKEEKKPATNRKVLKNNKKNK
jgi:sec-independent protein translocase protein TatA